MGSIPNMSAEEFQQLIEGVLRRAVPPPPPPPQVIQDRFRAQDLGYFEPDNDKRHSETVDGRMTYHNVFSFTSRLRTKTQGVTTGNWQGQIVATNLDQCLKGKAENWYTNEISVTTPAGLKTSIDLWCFELESRFRESPGVVLTKLERLRYTIRDARPRKDPEEYVQVLATIT
ncbi:hypothetical protein BJ875DRAFT_45009 [Amylocarpus encephaloides]|uniref:Uncharacterized protein n=1 Tax=Amylocarpus encephaloides TaxID=45428 RepID=A0A9P7YH63_9HELO|nr:hypothetical protein BJ875DRAFT_45009 [Amylocarpus encephaloides]